MTMDAKTAENFVLLAEKAAKEVEAANGTWCDWSNRVYGIEGPFAQTFVTKADRKEFVMSPYATQVDGIGAKFRADKTLAEWDRVTMPIPHIALTNFKKVST